MNTIERLVRFACVGVSVAVVYMALYMAFLTMGWAQVIANAAAFGIAVAVQYLGQALLTFRARVWAQGQIVRFGAMIGCGFVTSAIITGIAAPAMGAADVEAAALVVLVLPVQNYLIMAGWVFRNGQQRTTLDFKA